jgi:hypothetical protein
MRLLVSIIISLLFPLVITIAPAIAGLIDLKYVNGSIIASARLDVVDGQVVSGVGAISGGGLIGTLSMTYIFPATAPAPLKATLASDCISGAVGCYDVGLFSCGCAFVGEDTVFNIGSTIPIDTDGIAFQVGGAALNYGLGLYDAGDRTVGAVLVGDAAPQPSILIAGMAGGTLQYQAVPEPTSLMLWTVGLIAVGIYKFRLGIT